MIGVPVEYKGKWIEALGRNHLNRLEFVDEFELL